MRDLRVAVLATVGLILLFAAQQAPFIERGDYKRQLVWEGVSPDGGYRLEMRRQATFPAFDGLDPSGTAHFAVMRTATGEIIAKHNVPLGEIFDLQRPRVVWTAAEVEVRDYDESQAQAVIRLALIR